MRIEHGKLSDGSASIKVRGRFDFSIYQEFGDAAKDVKGSGSCNVDLQEATYVDSSALGMLLLLKESVPRVKVSHPAPQVYRVLEIAGFHKLFEIA